MLEEIKVPDSLQHIEDSTLYGCSNLTIYGVEGSYAQQYANEQGISFIAI